MADQVVDYVLTAFPPPEMFTPRECTELKKRPIGSITAPLSDSALKTRQRIGQRLIDEIGSSDFTKIVALYPPWKFYTMKPLDKSRQNEEIVSRIYGFRKAGDVFIARSYSLESKADHNFPEMFTEVEEWSAEQNAAIGKHDKPEIFYDPLGYFLAGDTLFYGNSPNDVAFIKTLFAKEYIDKIKFE